MEISIRRLVGIHGRHLHQHTGRNTPVRHEHGMGESQHATWMEVVWRTVSTCAGFTNSTLGSSEMVCSVKPPHESSGCRWFVACSKTSEPQTTDTMACARDVLTEGSEIEEVTLHRVWQCPCNPARGIFGATDKWCKKTEEQKEEFACFWLHGLVPKAWTETQTCGPSIHLALWDARRGNLASISPMGQAASTPTTQTQTQANGLVEALFD